MTNKDLISQYVDTGLKIDRYQIDKLSSNDKRTYLRKRVITALNGNERLGNYELSLCKYDIKLDYVNKLLARGYPLYDYEFDVLTDDLKLAYVMKKFNNGNRLEKHELDVLADDLKPEYVIGLLKWETYCLKDYEFNLLPTIKKVMYLLDGNDCGQEHFDLYYNTLSGKDKFDYYSDIISVWDLNSLSNKEQQEYEQLKNIYDK
jgi:hypothetical protein